ncbi:oxidoreductase [Streptomyces griseocarneus]|uniref:oxidoreductase n=1 Tax=Streptomyces griseocarneus TaxID=51201 RepID=UPI0019B27A96|nr:oxidoreductase [Streptomyces griseocarneus]MBZ6472809.1 oxidoreductase [Streptomyces griseocarneus]GHG47452.1 oxidoreductase [Streptomyces griseocarneus]
MAVEYASLALEAVPRAGAEPTAGAGQVRRESTDFVVDGRPLLALLAAAGAVSPLASDVAPSPLTPHARALLPQDGPCADPPLESGRYVLYACPECARLECGVVTAVVEREGADVVWRDFAWQTGESTDPARDGYPGVGPFRFRADEYRAALAALTADGTAPPARRALLVGPRVALFARAAAGLRAGGIGAEITHDAAGAHADELRTYGAVAFDRTVDEAERAAVRAAFAAAGGDVTFLETPAPAAELLVAQLEQALRSVPGGERRLTGLSAVAGEARVETAEACRVRVTAYRPGRLRGARMLEVFDGLLEPGCHRVPLGPRVAFVVARTYGDVLVTRVGAGAHGRAHDENRFGAREATG